MALGLNGRNAVIARENPRRAVRLVKDKEATKVCLEAAGVPTPPSVARFAARHVELEQVRSLPTEWVMKPARGSQGRGILVATGSTPRGWRAGGRAELSPRQVLQHVVDIVDGRYSGWVADVALVEARLRPPAELATLAPGGLPDVRLVCLRDQPLLAMARLPTLAGGGKSNLHQGGIGVAVDLDSGRMVRAVHDGRTIRSHPDTGAALTGAVVPDWPRIVEIARRCGAATGLGYLGVDVVVDRTLGPVVLEVNSHPGLEIQNVCGADLRALIAAAPASGRFVS